MLKNMFYTLRNRNNGGGPDEYEEEFQEEPKRISKLGIFLVFLLFFGLVLLYLGTKTPVPIDFVVINTSSFSWSTKDSKKLCGKAGCPTYPEINLKGNLALRCVGVWIPENTGEETAIHFHIRRDGKPCGTQSAQAIIVVPYESEKENIMFNLALFHLKLSDLWKQAALQNYPEGYTVTAAEVEKELETTNRAEEIEIARTLGEDLLGKRLTWTIVVSTIAAFSSSVLIVTFSYLYWKRRRKRKIEQWKENRVQN
jgi:hypothetical protein